MADEQVQAITEAAGLGAGSAANASLWDRFTTWASDNKAVVYTVAGISLVATGAGIYYISATGATRRLDNTTIQQGEQRKSKKERRKAKKDAEQAVSRDSSVEAVVQGPTWLLTVRSV